MAITEKYLDVELATGLNDGTSEANAWQSFAAATAGWTTSGHRLNVKNPSSRYVANTTAVFTLHSTGTAPSMMRGYGSTIGDGVAAQFEDLTLQFSGVEIICESIDILNANPAAAANEMFYMNQVGGGIFRNCKGVRDGTDSNNTVRCYYIPTGGAVTNCYAEAMFDSDITTSLVGLIHLGDGVASHNIVKMKSDSGHWGTGNPVAGIYNSAGVEDGAACHRNIVYCDPAHAPAEHVAGIQLRGKGTGGSTSSSAAGSYCCTYNTVFNCGVGILTTDMGGTGSANTDAIANNLVAACRLSVDSHDDGGASRAPVQFHVGMAFDGTISGLAIPVRARRFTVDPFTDSANEDFSLNSNDGGGLVARASAVTASGSFPDIGAVQS